MSLGVVVKGAEGVVLAADSRVTLTAVFPGEKEQTVNFDNASKILAFSPPHGYVAAVTYGAAIIGGRTAHSYIPELELRLGNERRSVFEYAKELSDFFSDQWRSSKEPDVPLGAGMHFIVAGYDGDAPYGSVFAFEIPNAPKPDARNADDFGMTWGGQLNIATRLIHGYDPSFMAVVAQHLKLDGKQVAALAADLKRVLEFKIPYQILPLQDCVDLATFMVSTTTTAQRLGIGIRGVGGTIEVSYITRTRPLTWLRRKRLRAGNDRSHFSFSEETGHVE